MTRILGPPTVEPSRLAYNLSRVSTIKPHPRFVDDMFPELWDVGTFYDVDPTVLVAQSGKETGWGHYTGRVPHTFFNTCGLKIRDPSTLPPDDTLSHAQFASWALGADAHAQHLLAYCQQDLPDGVPLVDPRWVWVRKPTGVPIVHVSELGGRWAPSPTYGTDIETIIAKLTDKAG